MPSCDDAALSPTPFLMSLAARCFIRAPRVSSLGLLARVRPPAPAACWSSTFVLHSGHTRQSCVRAQRQLWTSRKAQTPANASAPVSRAEKAAAERKEQRRRDWAIIKQLTLNLWPRGEWSIRGRVVAGLFLLVGAKVRLRI